MADLIGSGSSDKDTDKVLVSLKKGAQLFKYGRKGKPKFCPFRLSSDESSLIWISNRGEKELKLATVLRIIPGQRTAVFRRFSCHEKEYLSFSLVYKSGERSLDLICKDKTEAEVWFAGLKALIAAGQGGRSKIDGCGWHQEGILEDGRDLSSNCFSDSSLSASLDISSPESSVFASTSSNRNSAERSTIFDKSDATNMYMKGASSDVLRISTSSAPSSSSHGSLLDDCDSLGDVYIWGEVICDISTRAGSDKYNPSIIGKTDVLSPRPLEANTVLDVQYVACGVRHAALITRQGEVFTWGEESGGRLGHGFGSDAIHPRLLEPLSASNVDFVSCGEFHTCAVTLAGDLYTWGDGKHYAGVLGHGNDVSHCVPKRVSGSLEGIQVSYVACGTWHTAIITSAGQLFTFGDGTFGVLGHGDRESCAYPREVESLKGLCTLTVACGVWHMAAVVEVIMTQSSASVSGKLFTWGDGDKYRLGHSDKEPRLKPTCVPSLIDYNFQKVACGHSLTIGLTTQGRIFSMGSTVYGQLGNPLSDGKSPCLVEDKLSIEYVGEISCGSYHVAVLTTRNEVYTWGKGANGRLGHGDIEDRKMPTLVETLKDRPVKQIACGLNFTAAICPHKWVSGADQSQCSSCRQPFGFTRKRHNCYNCGLVHCHTCSSKKALKAALSPNPAKPYRVCDSCYLKLTKMAESDALNIKRISSPFLAGEKVEAKSTKTTTSSNMDLAMLLDSKTTKHGKKIEPMPLMRSPFLMDSNQTFSRAGCQTGTHSLTNSRANSPFSRTLSPPRSITPIPTTSGLSITKTLADSLKETNETLNKQLQQLRAEVQSLRQHCELQELELQKSAMRAQEAIRLAAEESAKTKAAKEVMKSLTTQLKDVAERLPAGAYDMDGMSPMYLTDETKIDVNGGAPLGNDLLCNASITPPVKNSGNGTQRLVRTQREHAEANEKSAPLVSWRSVCPNAGMEREYSYGIVQVPDRMGLAHVKEADSFPYYSHTSKTRSQSCDTLQRETEWLEQYEPGVYITLVALPDGIRDLKRVRFSRRRFGEHQAESWWSANREKVYEKYNIRAVDKSPTAPPA